MKTLIITNTILLLWLLPGMTWAQFIAVSGYINDSSNGKALENVSIFDSNSKIGTITNQNGFYSLILHEKKANLKFSYDGFKACFRRIELSADTTLLVSMEPNIIQRKQLKKGEELHADNISAQKQDLKRAVKQTPENE